jgi:glycosyltransferase involved in cell wall biosynthesis
VKIAFFSFYFPPDLSAGSFRAESIVEALNGNADIDVFTTQPNRYADHVAAASAIERRARATIHRFAVPAHSGGMVSQIRTFLAYARQARRAAWMSRPDVIVATTSRLFTAVLAAYVARRRKVPFYLDIRDIFVDTIKEVIHPAAFRLLSPLLTRLERFTIEQASVVSLVSPGFLPYFKSRYPSSRYAINTNGVDPIFAEAYATAASNHRPRSGPLQIVYAGNVGEGQGLHNVLPEAAKRLEGRAEFILYGNGGRITALRDRCAELRVANVQFRPPIPRSELLAVYREADVLFAHLNDYEAFLKVLPSKLFEYGATGRPIIAGVAGVAAQFFSEALPDIQLFKPGEIAGLCQAVERLDLSEPTPDRSDFIAKFNRLAISEQMAAEIVALAATGPAPCAV